MRTQPIPSVLIALGGVLGTLPAGAEPGVANPVPSNLASAALAKASFVPTEEPPGAACPIELSGDANASWRSAVRALEARADRPGADCAHIELVVSEGKATLTYATRDGRRAERTLREPSELDPTVLALGVTTPDLAPLDPGGDTAVRTRSNAASPSPQTGAPQNTRPPLKLTPTPQDDVADEGTQSGPSNLPADSKVLFGFGAGFRSGTRLVSPLFTGTAGLTIGHWELAVQGRYEAHYSYVAQAAGEGDPESDPPGTAGLGAGVTVGRRQPFGNTLLLGGISLNVTSLHDGTDESDPAESEAEAKAREERNGRAEARAGIYTGFVFPRRSSVRFRSDVSAEVVPHSIGTSEVGPDGIPVMPWWAVGLTLGMEFGAP